jgi:hypothetical protein
MKAIAFFAALTILHFADATESNDIDDNEDPGDCVCDLTENSCDVYCCCDSDCGSLVDEWDKDDPQDNLCLLNRFTDWPSRKCRRTESEHL